MPSEDATKLNWQVETTLRKWAVPADYEAGLPPDSIEQFKDNLLLNDGITRIVNRLGGAAVTAYDAANTRVGVGSSNTAAAAAQTDLQGGTKFYQLVSGAPSIVGQTITWVAAFGASDANFAWEEWGIDNGTASNTTPSPPMLNRKVQAMGTKVGGVWTFTVQISLS